jgi:hypothetical protein
MVPGTKPHIYPDTHTHTHTHTHPYPNIHRDTHTHTSIDCDKGDHLRGHRWPPETTDVTGHIIIRTLTGTPTLTRTLTVTLRLTH